MNWIEVLTDYSIINDRSVELTKDVGRDGWTSVKDAMERINGSWDKKLNAFMFPFNVPPVIEMLLETGTLPVRNKFAYFPTPDWVIDSIAKSTDLVYAISRAKRLCEPSSGTGWMANYMVKHMSKDAELICCEIDEPNIAVLKSNGHNVVEGDFLKYNPDEKFDVIFMNPPFQGITFAKHMRHAQKLLNEDGRLFAIMPEPWFNRKNPQQLLLELREDIMIANDQLTHDFFENAFEGTKINTMAGELLSISATKKKLANEQFINDAADELNLAIVNDWTYAEELQKIKSQYERDGNYTRACVGIMNHLERIMPLLAAKSIMVIRSLKARYHQDLIDHLELVDPNKKEFDDFVDENVNDIVDDIIESDKNIDNEFLDFFK
jgi:trans-aconitate methyltransferase